MKTTIKIAGFMFTAFFAATSFAADYATNPSADNTAMNKREAVTAEQAGMGKLDTELTRRIRQDVMKDKSLSTYAQNVKIISVNGTVTVKGPVRTAADEEKVLNYARAAAGNMNVVDEVTIVPEEKK